MLFIIRSNALVNWKACVFTVSVVWLCTDDITFRLPTFAPDKNSCASNHIYSVFLGSMHFWLSFNYNYLTLTRILNHISEVQKVVSVVTCLSSIQEAFAWSFRHKIFLPYSWLQSRFQSGTGLELSSAGTASNDRHATKYLFRRLSRSSSVYTRILPQKRRIWLHSKFLSIYHDMLRHSYSSSRHDPAAAQPPQLPPSSLQVYVVQLPSV
jgi:hypothetical protein